ncbi:putative F-box domain-containing protein [Rosa chinensis]|uniref:Putative F-box domain-containing protein n=1 Tax=Rosa chinensis TaxID=74649 RepID=A0A2P6RAF8_ROSCH|nr:F-box/kelch-repeat protein At3g06240 [Rosa chinensis]PRQ43409.1 putative F-box domain-containing protein [Rosa chinensis]
MEEANLPEEIIVLILSWLPVKSLLRFTCVSKRFHFIILSDPKFAKSQFQAACERKTLACRLLCSTTAPRVESLDLETPSFGDRSSVRKLKLPLRPPAGEVLPLGSCNGIVFLAFNEKIFNIWNPSTGFFKKLPDPGFSPKENELFVYGVGYLRATDDYKVVVASAGFTVDDKVEAAIFSSRADGWKTLEVDFDGSIAGQGTLLKEALHWLNDQEHEIVAFDLAQEDDEHKLRKMLPPNFHNERGRKHDIHLGVSTGGCLSLARYLRASADSIDVWVMRA